MRSYSGPKSSYVLLFTTSGQVQAIQCLLIPGADGDDAEIYRYLQQQEDTQVCRVRSYEGADQSTGGLRRKKQGRETSWGRQIFLSVFWQNLKITNLLHVKDISCQHMRKRHTERKPK